MPTIINPVSTQTTITAGLYNNIQSGVNYVLNTLYGGDMTTFAVSTGTVITPSYWNNLKTDIEKAYIHQAGMTLSTPIGKTPVSGGLIYADYVNSLITATNFISANTNTHAANQMSLATEGAGAAVSRRTTSWGSTLTHQVVYTWTTSTEAGYFFNLGGALLAQESYVTSTAGAGTTETQWMSMISDIQARASDTANWFTASNYYSGTDVSISTSTTAFDGLDLTFSKVSDTQVRFDAVYRHLGWFSELDLVSTATYRVSVNSVPAERPQVQNSLFLGDAGAYVPFPTKTLSISQPDTFSWYSNKQSPTQVLYLTNLGTVDLTITDIQFSNNGGVTPYYTYGWGNTLPRVIGPGQTSTINLYYRGTTLGTTQQTVTFISNNDKGTKVIQFDCTAVAPLFEIATDPTSWNVTTSSLVVQSQFFPIIPDGYNIAEYSASVTGTGYRMDNNLISFTTTGTIDILSTGTGVNVLFNPTGLTTGTYVGTLSLSAVAVNGLTSSTSVSLSVDYTAPSNKNLGTWKSAAAEFNAVVGVSYDTVGGVNYVTIGVTGDRFNDNPSMRAQFADVGALGYTADSKYFEGYVLYKSPNNAAYCSFLNTYGAWIRNDNTDPVNYWVKRKYVIDVKTAGTHNWSFAADDYGYFAIDGTTLGDTRSLSDSYQTEHTGTVDLTEGVHILELAAVNSGDTAAIGVKLTAPNGTTVWSTLNPIRETDPYPGWGEVYRIALTKGTNAYRTFSYCMKDRQPAEGNRWGNYFSNDGSMFTVFDDGYGNIDFYINPKSTRAATPEVNTTLSNIPTLLYYYSPFGNRYTQLEPQPIGDGTQTRYFLGFDRFGNIRTSILPVPTAAPDYSLYVADPNQSDGLNKIAERAIAGVVEGALYSVAAEAYNAYLIGIGAETGFVATSIAEAAGSVLFEAGLAESILLGAELFTGIGVVVVVAGILTGDKIICTKLYKLGLLPEEVFKADQEFGAELRKTDPDAYDGYVSWARSIVDWMDAEGQGPKLWKALFWKETEDEKIQSWAKFVTNWTRYIATPWAEEMARVQGIRESSPLAGKLLMKLGLPISRYLGAWNRKNKKQENPAGITKGLALFATFAILTVGVSICNLIDKVKK